ncbi:hypothetical protein ACLMJK_002128 [Lecanora helva]
MAFIRKNGVHKPKNGQVRDWGSELLNAVVKDIGKSWNAFETEIMDCKSEWHNNLARLVENIREDLSAVEGVSIISMNPFLESLTSKKDLLRQALSIFFKEVSMLSRETKLEATMEEEDGFFMQAMLVLYEKLRKVEGSVFSCFSTMHVTKAKTGASPVIQQRALLHDSFIRGEQYAEILPGVKQKFFTGLENLQTELLKNLNAIFDMVLADFDLLFEVEELPDPKRDVLRGEIRAFVEKARGKINGDITMEFARAKTHRMK